MEFGGIGGGRGLLLRRAARCATLKNPPDHSTPDDPRAQNTAPASPGDPPAPARADGVRLPGELRHANGRLDVDAPHGARGPLLSAAGAAEHLRQIARRSSTHRQESPMHLVPRLHWAPITRVCQARPDDGPRAAAESLRGPAVVSAVPQSRRAVAPASTSHLIEPSPNHSVLLP